MSQAKRARLFEQPLLLGSARSWLSLLWDNKHIDRKFLPRAALVTLITLGTSPLRAFESVCYGRAVRKAVVHPSPVFIIGHWRTGTTHLHNLLTKDTNHGYISMFQAFAPGLCLVGDRLIKRPFNAFAKKLHPTREIDNIPLSMDNPEEEDLAIACMSPYSYLHMYTFPRRGRYYFEKYVTFFDELPEPVRNRWKEMYVSMVRKGSYAAGGKRLVIKNCADSARIRQLLDLFPEAKFIHIYRNPYDIFRSARHLYRTVLARAQIQSINLNELDTWVLDFYSQLMRKLLAERSLIPAGQYVEVKYEELDKTPLVQLRRIYETLGLPGFAEAEPAFVNYLDSISGYQKNVYQHDDNVINSVNRHWGFALDALGYQRLEPAAGNPPPGSGSG